MVISGVHGFSGMARAQEYIAQEYITCIVMLPTAILFPAHASIASATHDADITHNSMAMSACLEGRFSTKWLSKEGVTQSV